MPEAETIARRALAIRLKVRGEDHPDTAESYLILADILRHQGKLPEAEAIARRILAARLKALGEDHPDTASSYDSLGNALLGQGKWPEAEAMYRRALAIRLKARGEGHPDTADSYYLVGHALRDQGKLPEAEAMYRRALAIRLKARGEGHPDTADSYYSLGNALDDQGKLPEAEAMFRRALEISLKARGEGHPDTAVLCKALASVLDAQGKLPEAEAMFRRALEISLKARGEGRRSNFSAATYHASLAHALNHLGRADEALDALTAAVDAFDEARLRGAGGLDAAPGAGGDPSPALAISLARAGRGREAWNRWEHGLARGVLDEVAGRAARPLTPDDRAREANLLGRSQILDERLSRLSSRPRLTADDETRLDALRSEADELRRQVLEFQQGLDRKYGPLTGKAVALEEVRAALPDDTALIGWVDSEHYAAACVVRRSGDPAWVILPGSRPDGSQSREDGARVRHLREVLAERATAGDWRPLAEAVARQRLGPVEPLLKGVRLVIVIHSPGLAGVPAEVLFAAAPGSQGGATAPGPVVAYAPSASMFAYLIRAKPPDERPARLLALGDPAYPAPTPGSDQAPPPPDHGLLVVKVEPNGIANLFGVQPGDVLLEYNGTLLKVQDDLRPVAADEGPKRVPIRLWRAGDVWQVEVAVGPLGVQFDPRPAARVVLAERAAAEVLTPSRGGPWARLPGTRREVAAIAGLFAAVYTTTLLGNQARESVVQDLARSGRLKEFRYLHFAAHGRYDPRSAYRTALLLAPDADRTGNPAAFEFDGEITAEQIARTWDLDADLVVLSACESGLGRQAGGEGFLGFAQPLLAKGARSLVLSLWKVDDRATSLLMARFYKNLLGERPGLTGPMPKAESLDEAKRWLRELTDEEAGVAEAGLNRGILRPLVTEGAPPSSTGARPSGPRRFAHPYYWAAFILAGDPS
jgi:tetratricopeptide (TPR) repeat protein